MFELNQLEQLITIAETGTVSKAAELLHLSQPALSRSIQRLEEELQVPLFDRHKNKISLNANGELALKFAKQLLGDANSMTLQLQAFERSRHTLSLGSCAPVPLWRLTPIISRQYPDMTIQSEIKSQDQLLCGLTGGTYQVIVTIAPADEPDTISFPYLDEHLYVALPPAHPLSSHQSLSLSDLNGQSMLILSKIGFWYDVCKEKMPDSLFLVQEEVTMLNELRRSSALPSFSTNLTMPKEEEQETRILVPLTDPEVNVTYYCHIKKADTKRLERFISALGYDLMT